MPSQPLIPSAEDAGHARPLRLASTDPALQAEVDEAIERITYYRQNAFADNTKQAYHSDWKAFQKFCDRYGFEILPAPPEVVAAFLSIEATRGERVSTIERRVAAIRMAHRLRELEPPTSSELVHSVLKGIRRDQLNSPNKKSAILSETVLQMAATADLTTLAGLRDRALLLLGFASALRRSELVAIKVEHLEFTEKGLRLHIPKSKTDQEGKGAVVPIVHGEDACPVEALQQWLRESGITYGPVFRRIYRSGRIGDGALTGHSVAVIIKQYAAKIGIEKEQVSGHSLRSGFLTSAAKNGTPVYDMMRISRHKEPRTVVEYIQKEKEFENHPAEGML